MTDDPVLDELRRMLAEAYERVEAARPPSPPRTLAEQAALRAIARRLLTEVPPDRLRDALREFARTAPAEQVAAAAGWLADARDNDEA
jgi:hypothetical protein